MKEKVIIENDFGEKVDAMAPVIVSASRSTDIPAYFGQWFINRFDKGHIVWFNPFNQKPSYVSFQNTRAIVFWTKNPKPFMKYIPLLNQKGVNFYFQYTLNDYDAEAFEPKVPLLSSRVETFKTLSSLIGKERVIWRFDPIVLTKDITPREILLRIWRIGNLIKGYTDKLVFSFIDISAYRKVQNNLVKECPTIFSKDNVLGCEPTKDQIQEICEGLVKIRDRWAQDGWKIELATCCEDVDLTKYGIKHNKCIDDELMKKTFAEDKALISFLSTGKLPSAQVETLDLFSSLETEEKPIKIINLKDKGQREICGCVVSKDIGMYNTCGHGCVYCYANQSRSVVKKNLQLHNPSGESLIPKVKVG